MYWNPSSRNEKKYQNFTVGNGICEIIDFTVCEIVYRVKRTQPASWLLPTRFRNDHKFRTLVNNHNISILATIVPKLHEKFQERFADHLNLTGNVKNAIIGSVSHPEFKLKWLQGEKYAKAKEIFEREVFENFSDEGVAQGREDKMLVDSDDFYYFPESDPSNQNVVQVRGRSAEEALNYLGSPRRDLKVLDTFPIIKKIFLKSNTPMASTGSIERVFNYGGMIDDAKRNRISPKTLQNNVFLKANQIFMAQYQFENPCLNVLDAIYERFLRDPLKTTDERSLEENWSG